MTKSCTLMIGGKPFVITEIDKRDLEYNLARLGRSRPGTQARRDAVLEIATRIAPASVRQICYQASVAGIIDKTERDFRKVQGDLVLLRRAEALAYDAIVDLTRHKLQPETWSSPREALRSIAGRYRKSLWDDRDCYVQVWVEKIGLAPIIEEVTEVYDVALMPARGYSGISFLSKTAADDLVDCGKRVFIYHLGDYDPSGQDAADNIEDELRHHAPGVDLTFERLAVTKRQIRDWSLPTRPTKPSDSRAAGFGEISVELDAMTPEQLRGLVADALAQHLPADEIAALRAQEEAERRQIAAAIADPTHELAREMTAYLAALPAA